jgi:hypothetical protein
VIEWDDNYFKFCDFENISIEGGVIGSDSSIVPSRTWTGTGDCSQVQTSLIAYSIIAYFEVLHFPIANLSNASWSTAGSYKTTWPQIATSRGQSLTGAQSKTARASRPKFVEGIWLWWDQAARLQRGCVRSFGR